MEGIVVGIAQINFHQNLSGIADENSSPNFAMESSTNMTSAPSYLLKSEEQQTVSEQDVDDGTLNNLIETDTTGDSGWEEVEEDDEKSSSNRRGYTMAERRQMPSRASKESSMLGIKRRTIMKPSKRVRNTDDFQNLKPADIKKIYLSKKLTNFRPSSLETIFEEASTTTQNNNEQDYSRLMGGRKIKRALSCTDGFRYSKTLVNKRRAKIKKTFGKRFALKKISLEEFITKLNDSIEKNDNNETNTSECQEQREDESNLNETATKFSCSEMFVSNISDPIEDDAMMPNDIPSTELANEMSL